MDVEALHRTLVDSWVRTVEKVGADQWRLPTPCSEWDVRALVNHLVGEDLWTPPMLAGRTIAEVGDRFDGDVLGEDPAALARSAGTDARAAVATALAGPAGGEAIVHLSYGDERLEEYLRQLCADHLVHSWDLAVAIGATPEADAEAVGTVADWFAERAELYRAFGIIGDRVELPESERDPLTRLIAAFGRDPGWAAPQ